MPERCGGCGGCGVAPVRSLQSAHARGRTRAYPIALAMYWGTEPHNPHNPDNRERDCAVLAPSQTHLPPLEAKLPMSAGLSCSGAIGRSGRDRRYPTAVLLPVVPTSVSRRRAILGAECDRERRLDHRRYQECPSDNARVVRGPGRYSVEGER
jgi:hypothetical protein